jgi:hypothetical protein
MAAAIEGRALLGMARDNKTDEIRSAVALGVPVDFTNPVRARRAPGRGPRGLVGPRTQLGRRGGAAPTDDAPPPPTPARCHTHTHTP